MEQVMICLNKLKKLNLNYKVEYPKIVYYLDKLKEYYTLNPNLTKDEYINYLKQL